MNWHLDKNWHICDVCAHIVVQRKCDIKGQVPVCPRLAHGDVRRDYWLCILIIKIASNILQKTREVVYDKEY